MRFALTEEQTQLAATARKVLSDEAERTPLGSPTLNRDLLATLAGLGLLGLPVDERLGGAGAGIVELTVLAEEVGAALPTIPFAASTVVSTLTLAALDEPVAHEALARLLDGSATCTVAWSGELGPVQFGADADYLITRLDGAITLVDLTDASVVRTPVAGFDPSEPVATVVLNGVRPLLVASPARTAEVVTAVTPPVLTTLAAELVGTGQRALDDAVAYAKQREQFGRVIGSFQAVKHMLADRHVQLDAARSLVRYAAWAIDNGEPNAELAAHTALAAASDAASAATADNLQTHGGIGFTWEQSAHRYLRRTRARRSLLGTPARQLDRIADRILTPA
jgi:alkylation response protein AidB-like acyl-CoA dehydrogenase